MDDSRVVGNLHQLILKNLPVSDFQIRQWDSDGSMLGTWNWAKEYEIDSTGQRIDHVANFSAFANFGFARVDDQWSQIVSSNTNFNRSFNLDLSAIEYKSAEVYASGNLWKSGQVVSKWSEINVYVTINNPTDYNFSNLFLNMDISNNKGFARESITLSPKGETTRQYFMEGFLGRANISQNNYVFGLKFFR